MYSIENITKQGEMYIVTVTKEGEEEKLIYKWIIPREENGELLFSESQFQEMIQKEMELRLRQLNSSLEEQDVTAAFTISE